MGWGVKKSVWRICIAANISALVIVTLAWNSVYGTLKFQQIFIETNSTKRDNYEHTVWPTSHYNGSPKKHLYYLKIHKTGSSTFNHLLKGFAIRNNLKYPVFSTQDVYGPEPALTDLLYPMQSAVKYALSHDMSSVSQQDIDYLLAIPRETRIAENQCDIIDTHTYCNPQAVYKIMPNDTVFVVSVREPFSHFLSVANEYGAWARIGLQNSSSPFRDAFTDSLKDVMESYRNRQAKEMGCDLRVATVQDCVDYVNKTFHLAIIAEKYHESLVLFRRHMRWTTKDVLYLKVNAKNYKEKTVQYNDSARQYHMKWSKFDYALYEMIAKRQNVVVQSLGIKFSEEVKELDFIIANVSSFCIPIIHKVVDCRKSSGNCELLLNSELTVSCSRSFTVNATECLVMGYHTQSMIPLIYLKQFYPWLCYPNFQDLLQRTGFSPGFEYNPKICPEPNMSFEYNYPRSMVHYGRYGPGF